MIYVHSEVNLFVICTLGSKICDDCTLYIVNIGHPMWRIPIYIASDGLTLSKNVWGRAVRRALHVLGNERPSRAICIGVRRIGCRIFTIYMYEVSTLEIRLDEY